MSHRTIFGRVAVFTVLAMTLLSPAPVRAQDHPDIESDVEKRTAVSPTGASADQRLAMEVEMVLKEETSWGTIRVERVEDGIVWLGGTTADEASLADALEVVEDLEGIREIRNGVQVTTPVVTQDAP